MESLGSPQYPFSTTVSHVHIHLQIPPRLLVRVPRIGRGFMICDGLVPEQKLEILELTDGTCVYVYSVYMYIPSLSS